MAVMGVAVELSAKDLNASGEINKVALSLTEMQAAANRAAGAVAGGFTVQVAGAGAASLEAAGRHGEHATALTRLGETFRETAQQAIAFGAGMVGIQLGQELFESLKQSLIDLPEQFEKARISFETFTGSSSTAAALVSQIQGLGGTDPFHTSALLDVATTLIALGTPAEQVAGRIQDIATAVAAVGGTESDLQAVTQSLARMQETGVVTSRTMLQLVNQHIPAWQILEVGLGKTEAQLQTMLKTGEITSDVFQEAFHTWATSGDVADVLAKRADTVSGSMTILQNKMQDATVTALVPLTERLNAAAAATTAFAQSGELAALGTTAAAGLTGLLNVLDSINLKFIAGAVGIVAAVAAWGAIGPTVTAAATAVTLFAERLGVMGVVEALAAGATKDLELQMLLMNLEAGGTTAALDIASLSVGRFGTAIYAALGPVGLVAIAVGALAVGYETNFLGMRDITDQATSRIVGDLEILANAGVKAKDATAQIAAAAAAPLPGLSREQSVAIKAQYTGPQTTSPTSLNLGPIASDFVATANAGNPLAVTLRVIQAGIDAVRQASGQLDPVLMEMNQPIERGADAWDHQDIALRTVAAHVRQSREDFELQKLSLNDVDAAAGGYTDALGALNIALAQEAALSNAVLLAQNAPVDRGSDRYEGQTLASVSARAANDALLASFDKVPKVADAAGKSVAAFGQNALVALPGLSALDMAIASTQQDLAKVQLQIEERKFERMSARPRISLGSQEAYLEEQLKIEQLQKAAGYTVATEGIKISNAAVTASNQAASHVTHVHQPTINVNGSGDPHAVAAHVVSLLTSSGSNSPGKANVQLAGVR